MKEDILPRSHSRQGYALLSVVIFALVIIIGGMAFFAMSSYETRQALYRQNSNEAFYLADGAVERARAAFLADGAWRDGFSNVAAGNGEYDLAMTDTTFSGVPDALRLLATGSVRGAARSIEVMAELKPTVFGLSLLVMGDLDVKGNFCVEGPPIHSNGSIGSSAGHLHCGGEVETGFELLPPPMYTDPAHFPDATYYYIRGNKIGSTYQARIYNEFGVDITSILRDSLTTVTSYNAARKAFIYSFDSQSKLQQYFNEVTGVFKRAHGDQAVVVNFGETPIVNPPGALGISDLVFDGSTSFSIHATIIDTRFTGVTLEQRYDTSFWKGGLTTVKKITFEPSYGIAVVPHDFQRQGGSLVQMGTAAWPALIYATGSVVTLNSNYEHIGGFLCLGDWHSSGGPELTYDSDFLASMPGWLVEDWAEGQSGTMRILRWREIASSP